MLLSEMPRFGIAEPELLGEELERLQFRQEEVLFIKFFRLLLGFRIEPCFLLSLLEPLPDRVENDPMCIDTSKDRDLIGYIKVEVLPLHVMGT
jgi:hypothetical protein